MNYTNEQIATLLAAITPGKWRAGPLTNHDYNVSWGVGGEKSNIFFAQGRCNKQNAHFIAAAPAIVAQQQERIKELEKALRDIAQELHDLVFSEGYSCPMCGGAFKPQEPHEDNCPIKIARGGDA